MGEDPSAWGRWVQPQVPVRSQEKHCPLFNVSPVPLGLRSPRMELGNQRNQMPRVYSATEPRPGRAQEACFRHPYCLICLIAVIRVCISRSFPLGNINWSPVPRLWPTSHFFPSLTLSFTEGTLWSQNAYGQDLTPSFTSFVIVGKLLILTVRFPYL